MVCTARLICRSGLVDLVSMTRRRASRPGRCGVGEARLLDNPQALRATRGRRRPARRHPGPAVEGVTATWPVGRGQVYDLERRLWSYGNGFREHEASTEFSSVSSTEVPQQ
jgi:hypothetical protein